MRFQCVLKCLKLTKFRFSRWQMLSSHSFKQKMTKLCALKIGKSSIRNFRNSLKNQCYKLTEDWILQMFWPKIWSNPKRLILTPLSTWSWKRNLSKKVTKLGLCVWMNYNWDNLYRRILTMSSFLKVVHLLLSATFLNLKMLRLWMRPLPRVPLQVPKSFPWMIWTKFKKF